MQYQHNQTPNEPLEWDDWAQVRVVAVVGGGNDWAAYVGPAQMCEEWVKDRGEKLSEKAARELFPCFAELSYRE